MWRDVLAIILAVFVSTACHAQDNETLFAANVNSYQGAVSLKDYKSAEKYALEALRLGQILRAAEPTTLAALNLNLADSYRKNQKYQEAMDSYDRAIEHYNAAGDDGRKAIILTQIAKGQIIKYLKRESGFANFNDAADNARKWFGPDSRELAQVEFAHGNELYARADSEPLQIMRHLNAASDIYRKLEGESSPNLIPIYHMAGKARLSASKTKAAIDYFDKALGLLKQHRQTDVELMVRATMISALDKIGDEERCIAETQLFALQLGEGDRSKAEPLVRYIPEYPMAAGEMGRSGWVNFKFGIDKYGHVSNPVVIEAEPPGFFENSAKAAFKKWRYAPKVVAGQPVDSEGYEVKVRYVLEKR